MGARTGRLEQGALRRTTRENHETGLRRSGAKIRRQTSALVALTVKTENRSAELERRHRTRDGGKQKQGIDSDL
jgi:hypothetical protein